MYTRCMRRVNGVRESSRAEQNKEQTGVLRGANEAVLEALLEHLVDLEAHGAAGDCNDQVRPVQTPHIEQQAAHFLHHLPTRRLHRLVAIADSHELHRTNPILFVVSTVLRVLDELLLYLYEYVHHTVMKIDMYCLNTSNSFCTVQCLLYSLMSYCISQ